MILAGDPEHLAPYAMRSVYSRGRRFAEPEHPFRSIFQRDRERIVHCTAFRRLMGKTQVHVGQVNDHHRNRLTHSLEVAQIARTIARKLRLNEDLVEAIALSHDLGHPPFGHAGERELHLQIQHCSGFDHNLNGLRRVDLLEDRYPEFAGLNLSWELREAFVQHSKRKDHPTAQEFLAIGAPLLEAQLCDAADSLAYDSHDTDDALGLKLITLQDLEDVAIWHQTAEVVRKRYGQLPSDPFRRAIIRELIAQQVQDLIQETEQRLLKWKIETVEDVRNSNQEIVGFSDEIRQMKGELESFLLEKVYRHHLVVGAAFRGQCVLRHLFQAYGNRPELLPERHLRRWKHAPTRLTSYDREPYAADRRSEEHLELVIADYLAGMTDRFAIQEHQRLFPTAAE